MKDAIKWIAIGLGAYWLYESYFATPAPATPSAADTAAAAAAAAAAKAATAAAGFTSLASIYSRMVAAAPSNASLTADGWNVYLKSVSAVTPPDPGSVFTFTDANPRTATMTAAQYWSLMEPYLVTQGMSGLGLYRGMGSFYRRARA
jgi:hypothetical protein